MPSKPPGKPIPKVAPTHLLMSEILITGKKKPLMPNKETRQALDQKIRPLETWGVSLILLMVLPFLCSSLIYGEK